MVVVAVVYLQSCESCQCAAEPAFGAQVMLMILACISPAATWAVDLMRPGQFPSVCKDSLKTTGTCYCAKQTRVLAGSAQCTVPEYCKAGAASGKAIWALLAST